LSILTEYFNNIYDGLSVSDSTINSLSTALSDVPSLVPTKNYYPELLRSTELGNAMKAQNL
jgi:hypothetical protein